MQSWTKDKILIPVEPTLKSGKTEKKTYKNKFKIYFQGFVCGMKIIKQGEGERIDVSCYFK